MKKDILNNNTYHTPALETAGLFDKIIRSVALEKEQKQTKKIVWAFLFLFFISTLLLPFSLSFLVSQWNSSGIYYFILSIFGNFGAFLSLWQDFTLSILESLPITAMILFAINLAVFLFSVRLFIYRKGLMLKYIGDHFFKISVRAH